MMTSRTVAVAQTTPVKGDVAANIEEHLKLARMAAEEKADLVLYPELSLTGYELELASDLAFGETDSRLSPLVDFAEKACIRLIVGAPVLINHKLHIGAFIILPDRPIQIYTKHHLGTFPPSSACDSLSGAIPPPEPRVFCAGDRNPLITFDDTIAAVAVCADIGRPSHPARAAECSANLYLASMFVIPSDFEAEAAKLSRYAAQYQMTVALANFGAPSGDLRSAGRSTIWSPAGERLVQLETSGSGIAVLNESSSIQRVRSTMLNR